MAKDHENKNKGRALKTTDEPRSRRQLSPHGFTDPFGMMEEFDRLFDEFHRSFDDLFWPVRRTRRHVRRPTVFRWPGWRRLSDWLPETTTDAFRQPTVDVKDNGNEFEVTAELPGIDKDDIDINLREDTVEIEAETKTANEDEDEDKGYYYKERSYSRFYRNLPLPEAVLPNDATAKLEDGVLNITIPKKEPVEEEKVHKIEIK